MKNKAVIIGIAGGSASGKTSIAQQLYDYFKGSHCVKIVKQDDYYKDQSHKSMEERIIKNSQIQDFSDYLVSEERSNATCEKYVRDVHSFWMFAGNNQVTKELVAAWKKDLQEHGIAVNDDVTTIDEAKEEIKKYLTKLAQGKQQNT